MNLFIEIASKCLTIHTFKTKRSGDKTIFKFSNDPSFIHDSFPDFASGLLFWQIWSWSFFLTL